MNRPSPAFPSPPALSAAGGPISLSGLLPSASLIESLLQASGELAAVGPLPTLQTRNTAAAIQRARLLSSLLEDLAAAFSAVGCASLPPSSILCLSELCSVVRRTKALLDDLAAGSLLWTLVNTEAAAKRFHSCARELAAALDILPLSLLPVSPDVREQVELLHRQAKCADLFLDPRELRLREELFSVIASYCAADKVFLDFREVEEIMRKIGLSTAAAYQEEIRRLEAEIPKQAGTGGLMAVSNINSIISFFSYARTIIFRCSKADSAMPRPPATVPAAPAALSRSSSWSVATEKTLSNFTFPEEFRCPITLDLMKDPVIVASGHTYERSSISRWLNSGHHTCPKSGQKLVHMALVPNYALKSLIERWCRDNNLPAVMWQKAPATSAEVHAPAVSAIDNISETRAAVEAVRMTAEFLVGKLAMGSPETQRQAAYELRLLAKTGMDNRRIIAEAGAIPFLITLLSSGDPRTQENAVTVLLNLSIFDNNKTLIMAAGAMDAIVTVLRTGAATEARENAAATIFSLSMMEDCKAAIGKRPEAIAGLVGLLREGTAAGKRDAVTALFNLALYNPNKAAVVAAGAVPVLVELLTDGKAGITDDALAMLALLCSCEEGMREIGKSRAVVAILVDLMRFGSAKGKENSIAVLLGLCKDGGEEMGRRLLMNARSVPSLQSLAATGSPRARRKADALLRLLNRCFSQSNSVHV